MTLSCFLHYPLNGVNSEAIFSQDVTKEGRELSGIRYIPLTNQTFGACAGTRAAIAFFVSFTVLLIVRVHSSSA